MDPQNSNFSGYSTNGANAHNSNIDAHGNQHPGFVGDGYRGNESLGATQHESLTGIKGESGDLPTLQQPMGYLGRHLGLDSIGSDHVQLAGQGGGSSVSAGQDKGMYLTGNIGDVNQGFVLDGLGASQDRLLFPTVSKEGVSSLGRAAPFGSTDANRGLYQAQTGMAQGYSMEASQALHETGSMAGVAPPAGPKRRGRKKKAPLKKVEILKSDEEMKPGLLEEPLIRHGKRARVSTQRLDPTPVKPRVKIIVIPDGIGVPLGEHIHVREQLARINPLDLKDMFKVLFDKPGLKATVKQEIKKFKGFAFQSHEEKIAKLQSIEARSTDHLRFMCEVLNVSKGPDRQSMVRNLMDFLCNPQPRPDDDVKKPTAKFLGLRKRPGPKRYLPGGGLEEYSTGTAGSESEGDRYGAQPRNAYLFFMDEMRPHVEAQFPGIATRDVLDKINKMWKSMMPRDRMHYEEMARMDPRRHDGQGKQRGHIGFGDAQGQESRTRLAGSGQHLVVPSEADFRKAVEDIVDEVGHQVTFKQVKFGVESRFPGLNLEDYKESLKLLAQDVVRKRSLMAPTTHNMAGSGRVMMAMQGTALGGQHLAQQQSMQSHLMQQAHHQQASHYNPTSQGQHHTGVMGTGMTREGHLMGTQMQPMVTMQMSQPVGQQAMYMQPPNPMASQPMVGMHMGNALPSPQMQYMTGPSMQYGGQQLDPSHFGQPHMQGNMLLG